MAEKKRKTVTKRLKTHLAKCKETGIYRNKTIKERMQRAIDRARQEIESMERISCRGIHPNTGRSAWRR